MNDLEKGERLFIVDLESVSIYPQEYLNFLLEDDKRYSKTPFLFLIMSLVRNQAMDWAGSNLEYQNKVKIGSWMVYSFLKK